MEKVSTIVWYYYTKDTIFLRLTRMAFEIVKDDQSSLIWSVIFGPDCFHVRKDNVVSELHGSFLVGPVIRGVPHIKSRWIGVLWVTTSFPLIEKLEW